uniref:FCP1 homology domain-containing protein n=1 Tax=viral metagenome TaxID=1070528 RepID=A0A6C0J0X4_9ZZZZ
MNRVTQKSTSLFNGVKLMIFDFDCTITNFHLSSSVTLEEISSRPLSEFIEAPLFKAFVEYLLRRGIQVAIASYGKKDIILGLMNRVFSNSIFDEDNVVTPRDISMEKNVKWSEGFNPSKRLLLNKNDMIQLLAHRLGLDLKEICLLDDTEEHIINARKLGCRAILVPKCEKFRQTLKTVLKHFLIPSEVELFMQDLDRPSSDHEESD